MKSAATSEWMIKPLFGAIWNLILAFLLVNETVVIVAYVSSAAPVVLDIHSTVGGGTAEDGRSQGMNTLKFCRASINIGVLAACQVVVGNAVQKGT